MTCCICNEKSIHTFFESDPIDGTPSRRARSSGIFKNRLEISFCEKHNFVCMPMLTDCKKDYHLHNKTECEKALALLLWSEFKPNSYINTILNGNTILNFLVKINEIDAQLYYSAISKLKQIMEIESDGLSFMVACFEKDFNIEKVLEYCKEHDEKVVQSWGFGSLFYEIIPNNPIDDKFTKKYRQCNNCNIWYLRTGLQNVDGGLKFKCINCVKIENILSDLPEMVNIFSSRCMSWINSKIPDVCTNEITAYLFNKEHITKFSHLSKTHYIKKECHQPNKKVRHN
jgi:hypothetical protein